ncbi:probable carboxylesterase 18 [Olea europaea var. sylvestris]|uniref:probable carboxylesterase 18 n=1 Tax=Olea europaea var. sylvestris TaxID=158386 RepID=UPI000C1D152F|nr:probable carboxylesterase 18 [Olea europaea var. sylvestris]
MAADQISKPYLPFMLRLKLCIGNFFTRICLRDDGTINRTLFDLLDRKVEAGSTLVIDNIHVSSSDVTVDHSRNLWFRLFVPRTTRKLPLVIYFHGGGFSFFGADSKPCNDFCRSFAAIFPAVIVSVNYRLAPEYRYPCQYEDGFDTLRFINAQNYNILPSNVELSKCFLAGDSAGGNIAHHVTFRACHNSQELDKLVIVGLVALQPFFGGEERTESELRLTKAPILNVEGTDRLWTMFLPQGADRNHPAVNVEPNFEAMDMKNTKFPSTLVIVGGFDPLQDWQTRYAQGLKKSGKQVELIKYPNAFHSFYGFPELPEFDLFVKDVRNFIQKQSIES